MGFFFFNGFGFKSSWTYVASFFCFSLIWNALTIVKKVLPFVFLYEVKQGYPPLLHYLITRFNKQGTHTSKNKNHQLKVDNCRPTNCAATPRITAKESRWNTKACASHSGIRACELQHWQMRESDSSAVGPKDPKVEKPNGMKLKPSEPTSGGMFDSLTLHNWW